jgi:stearoyl-CoA desaturase (delta-9 desaturase)
MEARTVSSGCALLWEGWHNNHHYYQSAVNQGGFVEVDFSYYILAILSWFGIVWDLRNPS